MFATNRFRRVQDAWLATRSWASRPRVKRWLLLIAFAVFAVLAVLAFQNLPDGAELRPWFMVALALIGVPVTWLLNTLEYRAMAKAAGHHVRFDTALQVNLAASVANLLPAPGGVAVKTAALKIEGSSLISALSVVAIAGVIWIGATAALVGIALLTDPAFVVRGVVVGTIGAAIVVGGALALRRRLPGWRKMFVELLVIETATTLAAALKVALGFAAIGEPVSLAGAVTIASATVLAAAIGLFPAGMGLREALAGGLAVAIQVPAAAAVAASAIERVAALVGQALYVPALGLYLRKTARRRVVEESESATASAALDPQALAGPSTGHGSSKR